MTNRAYALVLLVLFLAGCSQSDAPKSEHQSGPYDHVYLPGDELAINEILKRFPDYVVDDSRLETYATEFVKGYSAMPVRFTS